MPDFEKPPEWGMKWDVSMKPDGSWKACPNCGHNFVAASTYGGDPFESHIVGFSHTSRQPSDVPETFLGEVIVDCPGCQSKMTSHLHVDGLEKARRLCPLWPAT